MNEQLDQALNDWLGRLAVDWAIRLEDVPRHLGHGEVANRLESFPVLASELRNQPLDMSAFKKAATNCWALGGQFDIIQIMEFANTPGSSTALARLLDDFPKDDAEAASRIDAFIEECVQFGISNRSIAGLLTGTILSAVFPKRFVDFRQNRWRGLADELDHPLFVSDKPTYGEMIVEAGRFAAELCETETFQRSWPSGEPLWTIAGVCWHANSDTGAERPNVPMYHYEEDEDYGEGDKVFRLHLMRERSPMLVEQAKKRWLADDPLLRCDVCGFSFVEVYGELGRDYIEAHHKVPLSSLKAGARTRVEDLAKVCANCHRMLHRDYECLEMSKLKGQLHVGRSSA